MSTRRERWLKMREKHVRRRLKHDARGWAWIKVGTKWKKSGRRWELPLLHKMPPVDLLQKNFEHGPPVDIGPVFWTLEVLPAKYRLPPVPFISGPVYAASRALGRHQRFCFHGYFRRRVTLVGRKADRMSGLARRYWGCNIVYMQNGYFPDNDPGGRRPNATDVANGVPPEEDHPWPGMPEGV